MIRLLPRFVAKRLAQTMQGRAALSFRPNFQASLCTQDKLEELVVPEQGFLHSSSMLERK
jgi:hypothetical protein